MEQKAINFFENKIEQIDIQLSGILRPEYRQHLETTKQIYELAIKAISKYNTER